MVDELTPQRAIEARYAELGEGGASSDAPMVEVWGDMERWRLALGRHELLFLPPVARWLVYDRLHDSWEPTDYGPGEVDFEVHEGRLLARHRTDGPRRTSSPPPAQEPGAETMIYDVLPFTARVMVEQGPDAGREFRVNGAGVVGRDPDVEVALDDGRASRRHAQLECRPDGTWAVTDLESANGTWVNARRVQGVQGLSSGDRVLVGDSTLVVRYGEDGNSA